jgi:hypothetical protein
MREKMHTKLFWLLAIHVTLAAVVPVTVRAEEIDDVESEMDTTLAESDAALKEAEDAQKRKKDEDKKLANAKQDAKNASASAKAREEKAKQEIFALDQQTVKIREERTKFEKQKAAALVRIEEINKQVRSKQIDREKALAERDAAKGEMDETQNTLAKQLEEQKRIEKEIVGFKRESGATIVEIDKLKKKLQDAEKRLSQLREKAKKDSARTVGLKDERDKLKRKIATVPTKVHIMKAKYDCDVVDGPKEAGGKLGMLKEGQVYEVYRIVNKKYLEFQFAQSRGYVTKNCFVAEKGGKSQAANTEAGQSAGSRQPAEKK